MNFSYDLSVGLSSHARRLDADETNVQTLTPLPEILTAPKVIILGASLMDSSFGSGDSLRPSIADYAAAAGFTGSVLVRSRSGANIASTRARFAEVKAEPGIAATEGQNVYVVHTGGNNVSSNRPWPGAQSAFSDNYMGLMQDITATDTVIPLPLTKRFYGKSDQPPYSEPFPVVPGDPSTEVNGSRPYNENVIHPAIAQYAPAWWSPTDGPRVTPYTIADRYPSLLGSDGVHGYQASLARFVMGRIAGRAMGVEDGASRSGRSYLFSVHRDDPNGMRIGAVNSYMSLGTGSFQNYPLLHGSVDLAGVFDPFTEVFCSDTPFGVSNNAGTSTYGRIPDGRFHNTEIVNKGVFVRDNQTYVLTFANLIPGDTVQVSAVGVRNAGGTNRRGTVALSSGESKNLDASNVSASNQVTFSPVLVPADGRLTLTLTVASDSQYGYLHGVLLDFL